MCVVRMVRGYHYFFFFFQAEDGIRDTSVTGVQTCALPISDVEAVRIEEAQRLGDLRLVEDRGVRDDADGQRRQADALSFFRDDPRGGRKPRLVDRKSVV